MRDQRKQYTKAKSYSALNQERHPYMRPEFWVEKLVFWDNDTHNRAAYQDFHQRMIAEAGRRGKV